MWLGGMETLIGQYNIRAYLVCNRQVCSGRGEWLALPQALEDVPGQTLGKSPKPGCGALRLAHSSSQYLQRKIKYQHS